MRLTADARLRLAWRADTRRRSAARRRANVLTGGLDLEHETGVFDDGFSRVSPTRNNLGVYVQDQLAWRERLFVTAGLRVERNTPDVPADLRAPLTSLGSAAPAG